MSSSTPRTPVSNHYVVKRRQIRKGTFSCWECKRRKTKCEFKDKTGSACVSCQRRGTSCIGQQFAGPEQSSDERVEERIGLVGLHINQLAQQKNAQDPLLGSPNVIEQGNTSDFSEDTLNQTAGFNRKNDTNRPLSSLLTTAHKIYPGSRSLSSQLFAIFPRPNEAELLLTRINFSNLSIHIRGQASKKSRSSVIAQVPERPPSTAHPVHFACKLIQFALCCHQVEPPDYDTARRYVDIASRFVTSQDFLMDSMDGVETLMLECCYNINVGDLRSAWLALRRAVSIAQLLGSRDENLWFRLVFGDRSLSWVLGLPLSVTDNDFATDHGLAADAWSEKLERNHAIILGHIISRNTSMQRRRRRLVDHGEDTAYDDCKATQEIAHQLKQAAQSVPTDWWLCPTVKDGHVHVDTMAKTGDLVAQMHHGFIVVALYQPYLVHHSSHLGIFNNTTAALLPFDDYHSQTAIISASREMLTRFLALRSMHRTLSYRGMDDKAFMGGMMVLLVHLLGHDPGRANGFEHQRQHDLAIVNEVIRTLEAVSTAAKDTLSGAKVRVLKTLRMIEQHAADGRQCIVWMEEAPAKNNRYQVGEDFDGFSLPVPYFGSIRIAPQKPVDPTFSMEPVPALSTSSECGPIENIIRNQDQLCISPLTGLPLQNVACSDNSNEHDGDLNVPWLMDPDLEHMLQSPTCILRGIPESDGVPNEGTHPSQAIDDAFLHPLLSDELTVAGYEVDTLI